eukprot:m.188260 g.188260  ORF g.188260 m.188260 type:complete len:101 (-) comp16722_c0_seq24:154-456(-)
MFGGSLFVPTPKTKCSVSFYTTNKFVTVPKTSRHIEVKVLPPQVSLGGAWTFRLVFDMSSKAKSVSYKTTMKDVSREITRCFVSNLTLIFRLPGKEKETL